MKIRQHVVFDELEPGDIIVCCNGVVWSSPATVLAKRPGEMQGHVMIDYVTTGQKPGETVGDCDTDHPVIVADALYTDDCVWLVEMPRWRATPKSNACLMRSVA